ncbi:MAG: hypothetical protein MUC95_07235 [Spirochaetes bacterium]|jgi:hypothetical protein|nr:hypothetical protein [Spirochaetota bacterium]
MLLILSCSHNRKAVNNYTLILIVRDGLGVNREEVNNVFMQYFKPGAESGDTVEVVIFAYSSGKETFSYNGDGDGGIKSNTDEGSIEALIKIKENNKLEDTSFLRARGSSKDELLRKIAAGIISSFP